MPSGVYVPVGGKKLLTFMDDFNMPAKDTFGSQPPLELIKQWIDYGFWYDRQKQTVKQIKVGHIPRYTLQYGEREQLYCFINMFCPMIQEDVVYLVQKKLARRNSFVSLVWLNCQVLRLSNILVYVGFHGNESSRKVKSEVDMQTYV